MAENSELKEFEGVKGVRAKCDAGVRASVRVELEYRLLTPERSDNSFNSFNFPKLNFLNFNS